jgi:hypothetical protein
MVSVGWKSTGQQPLRKWPVENPDFAEVLILVYLWPSTIPYGRDAKSRTVPPESPKIIKTFLRLATGPEGQ